MERIYDDMLDLVVGGTAGVKVYKTDDNRWVCTTGREYDAIPDREFLGGQFVKTSTGTYVRTLWDVFDTEDAARVFDPTGQGLVITQPKNPDGPTIIEVPITISVNTK